MLFWKKERLFLAFFGKKREREKKERESKETSFLYFLVERNIVFCFFGKRNVSLCFSSKRSVSLCFFWKKEHLFWHFLVYRIAPPPLS